MNNKLVREDLHVLEVEPDLVWDLCNLEVMQNFTRDHDGSLKVYEKLLREEHNLRIVNIYDNAVGSVWSFKCSCSNYGNSPLG